VDSDPTALARQKYAAAPRLPAGAAIDVRTLLAGAFSRFELEIGPGRGGFLIGRLGAASDVGIVGLEVKRKWVVIVNERLSRAGLADRGRVFAEDARLALPRLEPDASVDALFLHFPDPWWKKRHSKRLVLGTDFLDQAARLLRPRGELFIQTDVDERAGLYETHVLGHHAFLPAGDVAGSARLRDNPYGAASHRERRALADGIPIHRLRFVRRG
jgi:tRNA (guanine-N7-)-methyltransferase